MELRASFQEIILSTLIASPIEFPYEKLVQTRVLVIVLNWACVDVKLLT